MVNLLKPGENKKLSSAQAKVEEAANSSEKQKAETELKQLQADLKKKFDESADSSEEGRQAKKEKEIREGKHVRKAELKFKRFQSDYEKAQVALTADPDNEDLKEDAEDASEVLEGATALVEEERQKQEELGKEKTIWDILENILLMLVTHNLFAAAAEMNLLPLIVFSIIFAAMLTTMGERVFAITRMIGQANDALMSFVMLLMNIAPIGIFCLVAAKFG
ncbi:MAG: cation:dicarboxylase symporter family transporter, partial [Verrucomicrobiales bacterium]|nr:cation:dicarboxylase symporter family transporter [Verrucomicrobiales bacterium]